MLEESPKLEAVTKTPEQEDAEAALRFFEKRLSGEKLIETPQDKNCKLAVVVPVYNEQSRRILKQMESIISQTGINPDEFEALYVVNNSPDDGSEKSKQTIAANQEILNLPIWKNRETDTDLSQLPEDKRKLYKEIREKFNFFVIDKSSPGDTIEDCNVGKARNRALAEASQRFYKNEKDGILVQTDADSYFGDPEFFSKVLSEFTKDPDVIGIAGGIKVEFDPDTNDPREKEILLKKAQQLLLDKKCQRFEKYLKDPSNPLWERDVFSGANMISKSFESATIGGFKDWNSGEDPQFGLDLKDYAQKRNKKVISKKLPVDDPDALLVTTAARESDRTQASLKRFLDKIDLTKPKYTVEDYNRLAEEASKTEEGRKLAEWFGSVELIIRDS